jgi:hypothetical protein
MDKNKASPRKQLSSLMYIYGALGLVFGVLHLFTYFSTGSSISLSDALFNAGDGILGLLAGWLFARGSKLAILVIVITILVSLVYSDLVGRGINLVTLLLGLVLLGWIAVLWRRGGLFSG